MARGKAKKSKNSKKSSFKHGVKKKEKKFSNRDITHRAQIIQARKLQQKAENHLERNIVDENEEVLEGLEVDAVSQLLSTFSSDKPGLRENVVDSDEESLEVEMEVANSEKIDSEIESSDVEESDGEDDLGGPLVGDIDEQDGDPFNEHFTYDLDPNLLDSVQSVPMRVSSHKLNWPLLLELKIDIPIQISSTEQKIDTINLLNDCIYTKPGTIPKRIQNTNLTALSIKSQIHKNIQSANKSQLDGSSSNDCFTPLQKELFSIINTYQDFYNSNRTLNNGEEVRFIYCLHVVNHILKTRLKIIHHNERLNNRSDSDVPDEFRDQGLVRPKVLILVPFRDSCYRIINMIKAILLSDNRANLINKARFKDDFTGGELFMPKINKKPEDFEALFAGNVDDSFKIGLSFTKKSLKLYSDFYSSDVIIASPLGLRMVIGGEGEKDRDFDFLASIEVFILDQAEVFLMQNWDHVLHIFNHIHMQPRESHGTDFSRVRNWAINGWTRYYRQTLLFSSIVTPELNAIFSRKCTNYAGAVRTVSPITSGSISRVLIPLPHVYRRFEASSVAEAIDKRYQFFIEEILPQFCELNGVLIYVPSYFDYVRLRNHLKDQDSSFVQICEYSKDAKVARARDMFYHNEARMLLYSERFHFFRRITLKGIRHLIFYQPPTFPNFYSELCNLMQESNQLKAVQDASLSVTVLFSKYDVHQLSGIVRTARTARIASSQKSVHMFTTGQ